MQTIESQYEDPWDELPEPTPVFVCFERCQDHGYNFVSMPRNQNQEYFGFKYKCPLSGCPHGIERHI